MNVNSYPLVIDGWSVGRLERRSKCSTLLGNHWIGRYDEPENTIEKYIQDCYSMYYERSILLLKDLSGGFMSSLLRTGVLDFTLTMMKPIVRVRVR